MTRATEAIKSDAMKLVNIKILGAIEAGEWLSLYHLSHQLRDIAERGIFHAKAGKIDSGSNRPTSDR